MIKTVITVDGMMCGMCESHVCECIRNSMDASKVKADRRTGLVTVISKLSPDEDLIRKKLNDTGYSVSSFSCEEIEEKRHFLSFLNKGKCS